MVKTLRGVNTLCRSLTIADPPRNGPYILLYKILMLKAETFVHVCYRHVAGLRNYDIGETLRCKVIKHWVFNHVKDGERDSTVIEIKVLVWILDR